MSEILKTTLDISAITPQNTGQTIQYENLVTDDQLEFQ